MTKDHDCALTPFGSGSWSRLQHTQLARTVCEPAHRRGLVIRAQRGPRRVPDRDAAHRQLTVKNVRFTMDPTKQPWGGYLATFADPDGNIFYLDQLRAE